MPHSYLYCTRVIFIILIVYYWLYVACCTILVSNNKVLAILYIGSIRIEFYEALSNHNIGSLKLAENLFACCRIPSLGQNSRFKTGCWLSDNNVYLVKLLLYIYSLSKLIYITLYKLFITNLVMHYSWGWNVAFNHKFN